jgi:hypothetical protein
MWERRRIIGKSPPGLIRTETLSFTRLPECTREKGAEVFTAMGVPCQEI